MNFSNKTKAFCRLRAKAFSALAAGIIFVFLFSGCSNFKDSKEQGKLCIASWNLQALMDGETLGTEFPEEFRDSRMWNRKDYEARLKTIAGIILRLSPAPDVILVQEVENDRVLFDLCQKYLKKAGYLYCGATSFPGGIQVGFVSKIPVNPEDVQVISTQVTSASFDEADLGQRPAMQIRLSTDFGDVVLWSVHSKSRKGGAKESESKRINTAFALKKAAREAHQLYPHAVLIFGGDFNADLEAGRRDFPGSQAALMAWDDPNAAFYEQNGSLLVAGNPDIAVWPEGTWYGFWYDGAINKEKNGSIAYMGRWEKFDNFFCSKEGFDHIALDFKSAGVYADRGLCGPDGFPDGYDLRTKKGVSDHLPIWIILD